MRSRTKVSMPFVAGLLFLAGAGTTSAETYPGKHLRADIEKWARIVKLADFRVD